MPRAAVRLVLHLILLLLVAAYPSRLLALELIIQQEKRLLVRLRRTHDGEHAFARFVVGLLRDGDLRA